MQFGVDAAYFDVPGWRFLELGETPQPGDVAARKENFADATGHSSVVVSVDKNGLVTAMAAHAKEDDLRVFRIVLRTIRLKTRHGDAGTGATTHYS